jgi:hypothetical protein
MRPLVQDGWSLCGPLTIASGDAGRAVRLLSIGWLDGPLEVLLDERVTRPVGDPREALGARVSEWGLL